VKNIVKNVTGVAKNVTGIVRNVTLKNITRAVMMATVLASLIHGSAQAQPPIGQAPAKARSMLNPFADDERARRAGEKLFRRECAECHGKNGVGAPKIPPLNIPMVTNAPPGAVFWVLRNGSLYRGMPSFAALPEPQRWQIVTYLDSLGAKTQ
jgi:mono/diheme cytochrome c family protein